MLISQRPSENKTPQNGKPTPFISRVYNRDPVGLPPIKNNLVVTIEKKPQLSYFEFRNKQIIKQIENLKKQEKDFLKEEENNQKKKIEKYREFTIKNNNNINELRKETYGEDFMNQVNNNNKSAAFSGNNNAENIEKKINEEKDGKQANDYVINDPNANYKYINAEEAKITNIENVNNRNKNNYIEKPQKAYSIREGNKT